MMSDPYEPSGLAAPEQGHSGTAEQADSGTVEQACSDTAEHVDATAVEQADGAPRRPHRIESRRAHLAGVQDSGPATTLWLSDERTTMHFPLTRATVPALLEQLREVAAEQDRPFGEDDSFEDDGAGRPALEEYGEPGIEPEPDTGRLARWTGWHYSNELVHRIPAKQRIALFAAVLVILLLITLFTR